MQSAALTGQWVVHAHVNPHAAPAQGHVSFASSHPGKQPGDRIMVEGLEQILFRDHAVQGTSGTDFAEGLQHDKLERIFEKGTTPNLDSFSGFFDSGKRRSTGLADYLKGLGVEVRHRMLACVPLHAARRTLLVWQVVKTVPGAPLFMSAAMPAPWGPPLSMLGVQKCAAPSLHPRNDISNNGLHAQDVYMCGMMIGQCVRATTLDALDEGFASVSVIEDACRGCYGPEGDTAALKEMASKGAKIVSIHDCL